jgi:hypothetical protein
MAVHAMNSMQDTPKLGQFQAQTISQKVQKILNKVFELCTEFFLVEMKA